MRLLFITQAVDECDPVLGFVCGWLRVFADTCSHISVVCLQKGKYHLPQNVSVFSLCSDTRCWRLQTSGVILRRIKYAARFLQYVWRARREYDAVFVHMNQEYILLAGVLWRLLGKPVALWYNHTAGTFLTKIAMRLANIIFYTSPYAFTANTNKSVRMPAGIDTNRFAPVPTIVRVPHSVLYLGRIAPIKGVKELIQGSRAPSYSYEDFSLSVYGDALTRDFVYAQEVRALAAPLVAAGKCCFLAGVPNTDAPRIFSAHEIFVNLTPAGNYDKTVLEASACGTIPIVSSPAFRDAFPPELFFEERNPASLAGALERVLALPEGERAHLAQRLREYVIRTHDLSLLVQKVYSLLHAQRA